MLSPNNLFNTVIDTLLDKQPLSIQELHALIDPQIPTSLPNLYKVVAELLDKQILLKSQKKLSLHTIWIKNIWSIYEKIEPRLKELPPSLTLELWETKLFYSDTLQNLDSVWRNVLHYFSENTADVQTLYIYNSHPYHVLWSFETESAGFKTLSRYGEQAVHFLFGNETFLDKYGAELLEQSGCVCTFSGKTPFATQGHFINIYGDYILEVVLPLAISNYFEVYFQTVQDIQSFPKAMFEQLFDMKMKYNLKVSYLPEEAERLRKQIKIHFH